MSRVAKVLHLPAVTAYLVTGLFLGPYMLGAAHIPYLGFASMDAVEGYNILSQVALGFIAFTIGNEFRVMQLKSMGRQAVTVGIFQAVITTVIVDAALCVLHVFRPDIISLPSAITLGAIAAATAPAATLMVVRQYKAHGLLTHLLLMVVAIDDAVGLVLFAASYGVANALEQGSVSVISVVVEPLLEIVLSLLLGTVAGLFMNWIEKYFHSREKRIAISVAFVLLMVGASMMEFDIGEVHIGFSLLLVCMMTGTVFCNICETSEELMGHVDQWTAPINVLFFIISGVALGMATTAANLSDGAVVRNVVLFSVLVYELVGPTLTKRSLIAAGEIATENPASERVINKTGNLRGLKLQVQRCLPWGNRWERRRA